MSPIPCPLSVLIPVPSPDVGNWAASLCCGHGGMASLFTTKRRRKTSFLLLSVSAPASLILPLLSQTSSPSLLKCCPRAAPDPPPRSKGQKDSLENKVYQISKPSCSFEGNSSLGCPGQFGWSILWEQLMSFDLSEYSWKNSPGIACLLPSSTYWQSEDQEDIKAVKGEFGGNLLLHLSSNDLTSAPEPMQALCIGKQPADLLCPSHHFVCFQPVFIWLWFPGTAGPWLT